MTTQHPTASRTRLPILIAAWLFIIAATVTMSSGLPGTAQAQAERGAIPSLNLASSEPGQLVITWETPDPAPTDYRLRWAPQPGTSCPTRMSTKRREATCIRSET